MYPLRFYIVGCQRTGTTLVRLVLEAHSQVFCYDELHAYEALRKKHFTPPPEKGVTRVGFKIPRWTEQLAGPMIVDSVDHQGTNQFYLGEPIIFMHRDVRGTVASMLRLEDGGEPWIEKWGRRILQDKIEKEPEFRTLFEEDLKKLKGFQYSPAAVGALYWKFKTVAFNDYKERGFPVIGVSYETLVTRPRDVLESVVSFLEIGWEDSLLRHEEVEHGEVFQGGLTLGKTDPGRAIDTRSVEGWKGSLTEQQIDEVMAIAGPLNERISQDLEKESDLGTGACPQRGLRHELCYQALGRFKLQSVEKESFAEAQSVEQEDRISETEEQIIFDQFSRYKACAELVETLRGGVPASALDVGSGETCLLGEFLPDLDITYVDPLLKEQAKHDPKKIGENIFSSQLDQGNYDYVLAIDTYEHIPGEHRARFLERLYSLAEEGVLIACPCSDQGTAQDVDEYVNGMFKTLFGTDYRWLEEHFLYGLPTAKEITEFFTAQGWHVYRKEHGHTAWLKELLAFVVCALEIPELWSTVDSVSDVFNSELYPYDSCKPCYRQIIVATREPVSFSKEVPEDIPRNVFQTWSRLQKQIMTTLLEQSKNSSIERDRIRGQLMNTSDWGKELEDDVKNRDAEIDRLNTLLQEATSWGRKVEEDVKNRDAEIDRLNGLIKNLTEWGKTSSKDVEERDSMIRRLQEELAKSTSDSQEEEE